MTFSNQVEVDNIDAGLVNGIKLKELAERIVYVNKDAEISGYITFASGVFVEKGLTVSKYINGVNISHLIATTMQKTGNQIVEVPTYFTDVVFSEDVVNTHMFNGLNLSYFSNHVVYKCHGDNKNITGTITLNGVKIEDLLSVGKLLVQGKINNIDIKELSKEAVTIAGNHTLIGLKKIIGYAAVQHATADTVNNYKFPEDFVTIKGNDNITARKLFSNDMSINGDLVMKDLKTINDVDISEIKKNMVSLTANDTVSTKVEFKAITVTKNLISSTINSVTVSEDNLLLRNKSQIVTGTKTFADVDTKQDVVSDNSINGFDLKQMQDETVLSGRVNVITGAKTINGNVSIQGI